MTAPLLSVRGLCKSFPGVRALADVDLEVRPGEVHALMGENGAGKSTLARLIAGLARPDAGTILLDGEPLHLRSPHDALRRGIAMIHQELLPFGEMTVAENVFMGSEPARLGGLWLDRRTMESRARALLERLGSDVSPRRRMGELSVAAMQTVEIARALVRRCRLIIMDEPTSALSLREAEALLGLIGELKAQGTAVLYVSHKLEEVFRIADRATVLRDGRHVATAAMGELTPGGLISLMVGREVEVPPAVERWSKGEVLLSLRNLTRKGEFQDVSLEVRAGEIVALAGLMGAGRTEVLSAVYGLRPAERGEIRVRGRAVAIRRPRQALAAGIAMVGEDRKRSGLVMSMSVKHNLTLIDLRRCCAGPLVRSGVENRLADRQIERFGIRTPSRDRCVRVLSGGNQQKVVLAKAMLTEPDVLLLDEPTRGIDVAAKAEMYELIRSLARSGKAILLASSELPEVPALSDRVVVMRQGRVTGELETHLASQEDVMRRAVLAEENA